MNNLYDLEHDAYEMAHDAVDALGALEGYALVLVTRARREGHTVTTEHWERIATGARQLHAEAKKLRDSAIDTPPEG